MINDVIINLMSQLTIHFV